MTDDRQGVLVRQLQGLLDGKEIRVGTDVVTFPGGAQDSNGTTVNHGLGRVPVYVGTQSLTLVSHARPGSRDASTFTVQHRTVDGSLPGAGVQHGFDWIAVG